MENERKRIPILIDTDLGDDVDDAAALLVVLNSPELDLRGITTVYKDTAKRAEMVKDLLKQKGAEGIPVIAGSERALIAVFFMIISPPRLPPFLLPLPLLLPYFLPQ